MSVPKQPGRQASSGSAAAEAVLAQIPPAELERLAAAMARVLLSAARNDWQPRRTIGTTARQSGKAEPRAETER